MPNKPIYKGESTEKCNEAEGIELVARRDLSLNRDLYQCFNANAIKLISHYKGM